MADGFDKPDEKYLYITDTGHEPGVSDVVGVNSYPTNPRSIYRVQWDADDKEPLLTGRTTRADQMGSR